MLIDNNNKLLLFHMHALFMAPTLFLINGNMTKSTKFYFPFSSSENCDNVDEIWFSHRRKMMIISCLLSFPYPEMYRMLIQVFDMIRRMS